VEQTQQRSFLRQIISRRRHGGLAAAELARPNPFPLFRVENSCIAALGEHSARVDLIAPGRFSGRMSAEWFLRAGVVQG
jgi:hypothetical protein